ncbi:MAG: glycosyltransferase family 39 protein [Candidatus Hinthialibacter antarcticus]|nr:glycosyltransferase family 39 protein [Candidatus Hinthialibacter antarcticus]
MFIKNVKLTPGVCLFLITFAWVFLLVVRLTAPNDLMNNDQQRPAAYTLDILINNNWLCQRDISGDITSKPPMFAWAAALSSMVTGGVERFTLLWPNAMSMLLLSWGLLALGSRYFGRMAGFTAALVFLLSPTGFKMISLIRTDTLFCFTTFFTAIFLYQSVYRQWNWLPFWLMAAASTLTKGPLGVFIAAGGLIALFACKPPQGWNRRGLIAGACAYFFICGGWFWAAWLVEGDALIAKMITKELVNHAVTSNSGDVIGGGWYKPILYFTSRFFPWSLCAWAAFWRVWKHPAKDNTVRQFEWFLLAYFFFGLLVFSLAPHQRADHLLPLLPAAALLAGAQIARWKAHWSSRQWAQYSIGLIVSFTGLFGLFYHTLDYHKEFKWLETIHETAEEIDSTLGRAFPLTYDNGPTALHVYRNTMSLDVSPDYIDDLLRSEYPAYWVAYQKSDEEIQTITNGANFFELKRLQATKNGKHLLRVISNQPLMQPSEKAATIIGDALIEMEGFVIQSVKHNLIRLKHTDEMASFRVTNLSNSKQKFKILYFPFRSIHELELEPGKTYSRSKFYLGPQYDFSKYLFHLIGISMWWIYLAVLIFAYQKTYHTLETAE